MTAAGRKRRRSQPRTRAREEIVAAIAERVRKGTALKHAAALEGVPERTIHDWMELLEVRDVLDVARAEDAERRRAEVERLALRGNAKGANVLLHLLARAHPKEWSEPPRRVETSGPNGAPQEQAIRVDIPLDELKRIARIRQEEET